METAALAIWSAGFAWLTIFLGELRTCLWSYADGERLDIAATHGPQSGLQGRNRILVTGGTASCVPWPIGLDRGGIRGETNGWFVLTRTGRQFLIRRAQRSDFLRDLAQSSDLRS